MATATARTARTEPLLPPGPTAGRVTQAARFHRDPLAFLERARRDFGDVFTLRLAVAGPMVMFTDPAVIDEVVDLAREAGDAGAARRRIVQMISEHSVLGADREQHRAARERLEPVFDVDRVDAHRETMTRIAEQHVERWPAGRPLRVLPHMRRLVDE